MPPPGCLISVIDDDESMLEALGGLLRLLGFKVETYGSGEEFMRTGLAHSPSCIFRDFDENSPVGSTHPAAVTVCRPCLKGFRP